MYEVIVSKTASKELFDLPSHAVNRIIPAIKKLGEDPRPAGCKKLKGRETPGASGLATTAWFT